jgi:hypothetical protein
VVRLPNYEIRTLFRRWLCTHINKHMDGRLRRKGAAMFLTAVSGSMASFSEEFRKLIFNTMPGQFLSNKEVVYQAYVCAFFTAASQALQVISRWEIEVECRAGSGCLDLIIQHMANRHGSIQEYKRVWPSAKEKGGGYGDSQRTRLTKAASKAIVELDARSYRGRIRDHVTELREYGVAFLGPYCAVEARLIKRKPGGQWEVKELYTADQDEARREQLYGVAPGPSG